MSRARWKGLAVLSLPALLLVALGAAFTPGSPPPALVAEGLDPDPTPAEPVLVDYKKVHEEADGGADSGVSPDGAWISYSHSKTGNRDIYAVHTETGEIRNLTNTPDDDWEARWHPDGTHIVFTGNRDGQNGVFIRNLDSGEEITIMSTKDGYEDYPSFSKDGRMVSFTAGPMGYREVYTWSWDTSEAKALTRGHNYVGSTNFSADGTRIVYHAYYGGSYQSEKADIFIVDAAGGRGENVTNNDDVWVYKAQWSPDGEWIAFSARYDTPNFNLWVMRPDGSQRTKITDVEGEDFRWADWTKDGRLAWHGIRAQKGRLFGVDTETGERHEMAFGDNYVHALSSSPDRSMLTYELGGDVFVAAAQQGAMPTRLTAGVDPVFSADGSTVAFSRKRQRQIGFVDVGGGDPVIVEQPVAEWPRTTADGWSPDGSRLVVIAGDDDEQDLVLITPDGKTRQLTDDGNPKSSPVWSADGRTVFYIENQANRVAYYITSSSVTEQLDAVGAQARGQ